ncbi:helicase-related protein [Parasphaerochaeta coccoides]|nr:ATP-dependent RNA helicase [Parasphaerochaeta coccoides]
MKELPVYRHRQEILDALAKNQVIIVESPTGSGKTTQLPIILHEAGYSQTGVIGITQPRRIATLSVSDFIRKQIDSSPGTSFVGYKMRFSDTTTHDTRIKVMTDGILLQELKADPMLSRYSVILVDEAHERSLNIDFILGLLKQILEQRSDFKVLISSATINTGIFSRFFNNAPVISIDARVHPVEIIYLSVENSNQIDTLVNTITSIVTQTVTEKGGDILIFLPGEFEIKTCIQNLLSSPVGNSLFIIPLFGRLSREDQEKVFIPTPNAKTKIVVATNIAETSITIDGIKVVIDSGLAKMNFYNQKDFTSSLVPLPVSRSSCDQRAGRAGRTAPGKCYRLYGKKDYDSRNTYTLEEIQRTDLSEVILRMSDLGILEYETFPFISPPKTSAISSAEKTLRFIGAIDQERYLTSIGEQMVKFPLPPRQSRVIVEGMLHYPDVMQEVIMAVSFLTSKTPFIFPPGEEDAARAAHKSLNSPEYGDFVMYLQLFSLYEHIALSRKDSFCKERYLDRQCMDEILNVNEQLSEIVSEIGFPLTHGGSVRDYLCCLASGLLQYVCCRMRGNVYKSLTADMIYIHPGSAWFRDLPQYILAGEIVQTSRLYARSVSPLRPEWLEQIHPGLEKKFAGLGRHDEGRQERRDSFVSSKNEGRGKKIASDRKTRKDSPDSRPQRPAFQDKQNGQGQDSQDGHQFSIYGHTYPVIKDKALAKDASLVVIPWDDLPVLKQANDKAAQRPRNFRVAVMYKGFAMHPGDKFFNALELVGKVNVSRGIQEKPPSGSYSVYDGSDLEEKLEVLLAPCKMKKDMQTLGFITLDTNGQGLYYFTAGKNCFEALDNSIYALGQLVDELRRTNLGATAKNTALLYRKLLSAFDA